MAAVKEKGKRSPKVLEAIRKSVLWRDFRHFLEGTWYLLRDNWAMVFPFLIVYSLANMVVTYLAVDLTIGWSMRLNGISYLSTDNLVSLLTAPSSITLLLLLFIVVCFLHVVEIAGIMHAYSMSMVGKKSSLEGMLLAGLHSGIQSTHPRNWTVLLFVMVLIPMTGFFTLSFSSLHAAVPGFVQDYINADVVYRTLYRLLFFALFLVEVVYIFAMNFYLLKKDSFTASCRMSRRLISGRYWKTLVFLLALACILTTVVVVFAAAVSALMVQAMSLFSFGLTSAEAERLGTWTKAISEFIGLVISPAVNIAALTSLFFRYVEDDNHLANLSRDSFRDRSLGKKQRIVLITAAVAVMAVSVTVTVREYAAEEPRQLPRPAIAAHRGDSVSAPENSLPAFELAVTEKTEWVELDVHQTKDGVIVVSHDDNLERISGQDVFVYDLTYDEILKMDVGSWFSDDYAGLHLATLDDVLKVCKDNAKVQIEIKPTDHDDHIEEAILKIVNENGMHDQVLILSLKPEPLKRVKELDPTMITAYCMVVAMEHIEDIPFADYYSVEESNVKPQLASRVHDAGGQLFAWTVNSDENVQYLVDCGVDAILTDDPAMMRNALSKAKYNTGLARYLRLYMKELREY